MMMYIGVDKQLMSRQRLPRSAPAIFWSDLPFAADDSNRLPAIMMRQPATVREMPSTLESVTRSVPRTPAAIIVNTG